MTSARKLLPAVSFAILVMAVALLFGGIGCTVANTSTPQASETSLGPDGAETAASHLPTPEATVAPALDGTLPSLGQSTATAETAPTAPSAVTSGANPTEVAMPDAVTPPPPLDIIPRPPDADILELARQLLPGLPQDLPLVGASPDPGLVEGSRETFFVADLLSVEVGQVEATLGLVSPNAYWFVADDVSVSRDELQDAAREFEERILPGVTDIFGPLWPPGTAPGRLTILHARLRGAAGYYSSSDEYPNQVRQYSNQRKMVYINALILRPGSREYLSTLAHELQHAVHWNLNRGQSTWLNEGLSQVAELRLGYESRTADTFAQSQPTSLVYWPIEPLNSAASYGAAFLFSHFLGIQPGVGNELTSLLKTGGKGIDAVDAFLEEFGAGEDFNTLFGRWTVANYWRKVGDGPFSYPDRLVKVPFTDVVRETGTMALSQPQYSARYVLLDLDDPSVAVGFAGMAEVSLFPEPPPNAGFCWWGNRGDSISTTLTRRFDLGGLDKATLQFRLWFDIESEWDYGYVQVSTNEGETWDILAGALATPRNPVGNSFGPGYSGFSDGWVEDQVDLTPYVGKRVLLRFHYVTDDAINAPGLCLDTIAVPELGFYDDASQDKGWRAEGFYRTDTTLPQDYSVWIVQARDGEWRVTPLELDASNQGNAELPGFGELDEAVVIIGSLARGSSLPAEYQLTVERLD